MLSDVPYAQYLHQKHGSALLVSYSWVHPQEALHYIIHLVVKQATHDYIPVALYQSWLLYSIFLVDFISYAHRIDLNDRYLSHILCCI
jgi:hypothetical protein